MRKSRVALLVASLMVGACSGNTQPTLAPLDVPTPLLSASLVAPTPPPSASLVAPTESAPSGPAAPQPPFNQAQADECKAQTHSILDAYFGIYGPGDGELYQATSRDQIQKALDPTLNAMLALQSSGSHLLEPRLSASIADLKTLRDELSSPMTANDIKAAGLRFMSDIKAVDYPRDYYQSGSDGTNPNCPMIDAWIAANVVK